MSKKVEIYVAAHKHFDNDKSLPSCYLPIQVGSEGKAELGYIRDNTGDNISAKNPSYCELTGLYWVYKNSDADIVGLCHYRRYFSSKPLDRKLKRILIEEKIISILEKYDVILPKKVKLGRKNVYEQYCSAHYEKDLLTTRRAIEELYPDYVADFDAVMQQKKTRQCNMFIASKELADRYCEWLFGVLKYVEDNTDISEYDNVQRRIYGYLGERLLCVWMNHENPKICEKWYASTELSLKLLKTALRDKIQKGN